MSEQKGKDLAVAYNVKRMANKKASCPDCMSAGGKCMAHGGDVENEKLAMDDERSSVPNMSDSGDMSDSDDSIVEAIMKARKMATGGLVEEDPDTDLDVEPRMNLEREHYIADDEHDSGGDPSEDDDKIISQILRERKQRRS